LPKDTNRISLTIAGDVGESVAASDALRPLPRVEQTSDFQCVTTWSRCALVWSGYRFSDFFDRVVVARARQARDATFVIFRWQDGYAVSLGLEDLLDVSALLADRLNGEPLTVAHGAPLGLVALAHYG